MTKQPKSNHCPKWLMISLTVLAIFLLLGGMIAVSLHRRNEPLSRETETESEPATEEQESAGLSDAYDLGYGLRLVGMTAAAGNFPEDGSEDFLPNMFCITVENTNQNMIRTAAIRLTVNDREYSFDMNSIPAGATVRLYEKNRASAPDPIRSFRGECSYAVFFEEQPSLDGDRLQITVEEQGITVKNITEEDIDQEISIYYKSVRDGVYVGGITYRVRVTRLNAGDEVTVYAAHAHEGYSEVMFIEYGD